MSVDVPRTPTLQEMYVTLTSKVPKHLDASIGSAASGSGTLW